MSGLPLYTLQFRRSGRTKSGYILLRNVKQTRTKCYPIKKYTTKHFSNIYCSLVLILIGIALEPSLNESGITVMEVLDFEGNVIVL